MPMLGRDAELVALVEGWDRAESGDAQLVGVVGDAGLGKSRLCDEFAQLAAARGVRVRRASGISHAQDAPLLPVLELLRVYFDIKEDDTPEQARQRVEARVREFDSALVERLPLLW